MHDFSSVHISASNHCLCDCCYHTDVNEIPTDFITILQKKHLFSSFYLGFCDCQEKHLGTTAIMN